MARDLLGAGAMQVTRNGFFSLLATLAVSACDASSPGPDTALDSAAELSDGSDAADATETGAFDGAEVTDADAFDSGDAADAEALDSDDAADVDDLSDAGDGAETTPACELEPGDPAFDDHTIARVPTTACFFDYAGPFVSDPVVLKYLVVDLNAGLPALADLRFQENGFYELHDEWYWFRLLNGQPIPHLSSPAPIPGLSFATIADIYLAFAGQTALPLDLEFLDPGGPFSGRLYSPHFYELAAFTTPLADRFFAVGSVLHFDANPERVHPEEIWGFELEYVDQPTIPYLERLVALLQAKLPAELRQELVWVARSPAQEVLVRELRATGHPLGSRALTYDDLVVDGAVEVYNEGITAGFVNILDPNFSGDDLHSDEIAIVPRVPDDIPPSRAIVSAVPQTAFAHVNLLAKSRGTPNAYVAGILEWGQLAAWAWSSQRVIMEASLAHGVRWLPLTSDQYNAYLARIAPPSRHVQQVPDLAAAPLTVSLSEGGLAEMSALVPLIGGKAAGFLSFLDVPAIETPDAPLAITIKSFVEHQAEFLPLFHEAFAQPEFIVDARVRFLVLEGEDAFLAASSDPVARAFVLAFAIDHAGDALGELFAAGGARQVMIDKPMKYETLRELRAALGLRFARLARTQALRFRSSSTAEDVPGFNGAGLYVSNTGFLYPSELADPADRTKTVEHAIKQTWGSYWGFQAFEERAAGRIDHFEGNMALAVHARFDDDRERANAVATYWYSAYPEAPTRRLVVNVQKGALAVTNPGGTLELPEIDEVSQIGDAAPQILRVRRSTLADPDEWLFSEAELRTLFMQASLHSDLWLANLGSSHPLSERPRTLVLDYELKYMSAGWPSLASGEVRPARIIWRQARVLDQAPRISPTLPDPWGAVGPALVTNLPLDLRTVVRSVVADRCDSEWADLRVYRLYSESSQASLFPFATTPFIYRVAIDFKKPPPNLTPSLSNWLLQWTNLSERRWDGSGTRVVVNPGIAQTLGLDGFELSAAPGGSFRVWQGDTEFSGTCTTREVREPYQSAADYLRSLMPPL